MFLLGSLYKDLLPKGLMASGVPLVAITTDTTTVGDTIDTQGYSRILLAMMDMTLTDGDYVFHLYHGDASDMSDEAEVASSDLNGTLASWTADTDDNKFVTAEYIGRKRYIRVKVVSTNTSSGVNAIGGLALLGQDEHGPVQT